MKTSNPRWNGHSRSALSLAVAMLAAPAFAQNTTSALSGYISAPDGKPVAGATVSILHQESGSVNNLVTDADGRYSARGLRVGGPYTVLITKDGKTEKREDVYLQLAETLSLNATLGNSLQAVTITGTANAKVFNSTNMGAGTSLGRKEIDAYASIQRNLQDYARLDPRLAQTDKERGEISAGGQNTRYNSITIDGVNINDTFGLESNNLPTTKQPISIDAIQSVQVNVSNYDVTQKGYTGANINAVTKSGTNEFKGSLTYVYRNDGLVGERYNRITDSYFPFLPFKEQTFGFTLGGPIIKDKLFFFLSAEDLESNRAQPEFGPVGSQFTNVGISQSAIDSLTVAAKAKGFDVGTVNGPTKLSAKDYLMKLDWNISEKHRANLRLARTEQSDTNNGAFGSYSPTSLQLTSQWWQQKKKIDTAVVQWFGDWTEDFSTELKVSQRNYNSVPLNNSALPAIALSFSGALPTDAPAGTNSGTRFLNFGTEQSRHFNVLDTKTSDIYFGGTLTRGDHEIKGGVDYARNTVYNAFFQNTYGNYTFGCTSSSATFTYSFGAITCATATAALVEQAVLENFNKGRPNSYQVQLPVAGGTLDDGIAKWALADTGVFVQDTWKVTKQLTVTGGVRVDTLSTGDKPAFNAAAAAPTVEGRVTGTTVVRNTGGFGLDNSVTVDGDRVIQPRVGFNYQFDREAKEKTQIRGGMGLFQGSAANVWLSNPYSNTGLATRITGCGTSGFAACPGTGGIFSADPLNQPVNFTGASPAANVDFIQNGLSQPSVWKLNLGLDTVLPWYDILASAEMLHTQNKSGIFYKHLNLGAPTFTGSDGRQLFYTPQAYNPACWTATGVATTSGVCTGFRAKALSNAAFNNVLQATETEAGGGNSLTLSLSGTGLPGLGWQVAYTKTRADEVSPLTSSVSNSNFNSRSIVNPNEEVSANSAYLVADRISAAVNWSKAFYGAYKTTFGMFYEGRKGKPYSWTFRNDFNGDGVSGNDLMYVPTAPGSGEVEFRGDSATSRVNEDRFWAIVKANDGLGTAPGTVAKRNSSFAAWVNSFDMRLSQEVPGFFAKNKGTFTVDVLNVGNLLNKNWGRIDELAFSGGGGSRRTFVNFGGINAQGKYIYIVADAADDVTTRQVKGESQWALQATLKYEF